jgi:hypothetical protein
MLRDFPLIVLGAGDTALRSVNSGEVRYLRRGRQIKNGLAPIGLRSNRGSRSQHILPARGEALVGNVSGQLL